jgi:hypothetical protein
MNNLNNIRAGLAPNGYGSADIQVRIKRKRETNVLPRIDSRGLIARINL